MTKTKSTRLTMSIALLTISFVFSQPRLACARQAASSAAQAGANPALETVTDSLAFVSWTTPNPGGTTLHYAIAHYGKDPNHLDLTAKSPTRINLSNKEMVFRVRIGNLEPGTTYYYKVSSEQATGLSDPVSSGVNTFTTRPANWMSASK
jgi:phosphodiesterase/alkaline phosphatase D-like protein